MTTINKTLEDKFVPGMTNKELEQYNSLTPYEKNQFLKLCYDEYIKHLDEIDSILKPVS